MKLELRETRKQGTSLHPLKIYGMQDINGKIDGPYHWQETVEILWIQCGRLSLMIKETLYEGKQGEKPAVRKQRDIFSVFQACCR